MTYKLKLGDKIDVYGNIFILTEVTETLNDPARVVFEQPIQLLARTAEAPEAKDTSEMSGMIINGKPLTWEEAADYWQEKYLEVGKWGLLVSDLDRCQHGRHGGDACFGCPREISAGNLEQGDLLGWDISGREYRMPSREGRHKFDNWTDARHDDD